MKVPLCGLTSRSLLRCSGWIQCSERVRISKKRSHGVTGESRIGSRIVARRRSSTRAASLGAGLRSGLIAEQADAGPRAGALLALRIGQEREKAHPKSEALQSRGSL
jgi:hypothetical protein